MGIEAAFAQADFDPNQTGKKKSAAGQQKNS
ncbi:MAG: hypothetical protein ACJARR_000233 [Pseudophaeobacter arcticus]